MNSDAAHQKLLEFSASSDGPIDLLNFCRQKFLLTIGQHAFSFELFGHAPAFVAVEAEHQSWRVARLFVAVGHNFQLVRKELISDPAKVQRHAAFVALQQSEFS